MNGSSVGKTQIALLIGSLFIFALVSFPQASTRTVPDVVSIASDAVVQIVVSNSAGQQTALGSGFIISADGRIVTNYHVIKGAHSAIVKLTSGAYFPAQGVVALDPERDLTILKVEGKKLPFLSVRAIENIHVGDHVVAIGSPLGLEGTVSDGIVSSMREIGGRTWIQTTAPVSHGNSGGPLLDMQGAVVGVITWGYLQLGENLNFAAPASDLKALLSRVHEPTALDAAGQLASPSPNSSHISDTDKVWTSLTTGRDYKVRIDGDYLYSDWTNMPPQLQGTGAFSRSELKKQPDGRWQGQGRVYLPCQYNDSWTGQPVVKWCRNEADMEIDRISDTRIEGVSESWSKYDCRKCQPKDAHKAPFTWIPKD